MSVSLPLIAETVAGLRARIAAWRKDGERIAMVPTMGALHRGHLELCHQARQEADRVVVSIFVNPTQFAPTEDFAAYPRDLSGDLAKLGEAGVDIVFAPTVEEMYPAGYATTIGVRGPAEGLETDFRPHFFAGVATVVSKLLIAALPDAAIFGEKDYQQLLVIRRLVRDLALPVTIVGHPIVREEDGLAMSSRNAYLSSAERDVAPELHRALAAAAKAIGAGELAGVAIETARQRIAKAGFDIDYLELRDADTLKPPQKQESERLRLLVAARLGRTRLIDNVAV
ncbi:MAG: pantoate--beta-alanine ligase [Bauldia sp.]